MCACEGGGDGARATPVGRLWFAAGTACGLHSTRAWPETVLARFNTPLPAGRRAAGPASSLAHPTATLLARPPRLFPLDAPCRYGNQEGHFVDPFVPYRGGGRSAFGVLEWGGCGLTNGDGTVLWPKDQVTSYGAGNPDFPGGGRWSCWCSAEASVAWSSPT